MYRRALNFAKSGIIVKGRRSPKLKINYRTTEKIKHLATRIVSNLSVEDFEGSQENLKEYLSLMHGDRHTYDTFITKEEEDKFILERLNVFIGGGSILPDEIWAELTRTNVGLDDLKKVLNNGNIKYSNRGKTDPKE